MKWLIWSTNLLKLMLPGLAFPSCKKNNLPKLYFDACRAVSQKTEKPRWKKCSRKKREKNRERKWVIAMSHARSSYGWRSATEELNMSNKTFWLWVQRGKRSPSYCSCCCCYYCCNPINDYFRPFLVTHNLANDKLRVVMEVTKTSYTIHSIS